ncbi:MAG: hypothetical protein EBT92_00035 [Planctomycetes bacterium]|nr:hypothetical protein [Planctomycetota bacterium]NBY01872.1 hypothetical protein [Planctomycetota bacterium]
MPGKYSQNQLRKGREEQKKSLAPLIFRLLNKTGEEQILIATPHLCKRASCSVWQMIKLQA